MPVLPLFSSILVCKQNAILPSHRGKNVVLGYRQIFLLSIKDVVCKEKVDCAISWYAAASGVWLGRELDYSEELHTKGPSGSLSLNPCYCQ